MSVGELAMLALARTLLCWLLLPLPPAPLKNSGERRAWWATLLTVGSGDAPYAGLPKMEAYGDPAAAGPVSCP